MINPFIAKQWEKNKDSYQEVISRAIAKGTFVYEYKYLVSYLITYVINKNLDKYDYRYNEETGTWNIPIKPLEDKPEKIIEITVGEFNGSYLYILKPKEGTTCLPELWLTKVYYGSCSGCDELLDAERIGNYEEKIKLIMKLSLDLIEEFKPLSEMYPV